MKLEWREKVRRPVLTKVGGFAALLALAVLGAGGAARTPDGWLLGVPSAARVGMVLLAAGALWWATRGAFVGRCLGLLWLPVLVLAGAPVAGLGALTGPPLLAVALAGVAASLFGSGFRPPRLLLLLAVLVVYATVSARVQLQVGPEGDEPHYLMVADSLLRDGDVSLERDYQEGRYRAFYDRALRPHYRVRGRDGEIYSLHAVGLSLLVLPAYALGGYPAASYFMALLAALLVFELRELLIRAGESEGGAEGVAWLAALSPPLIHYAGLIFTEIPAALLVAVALRRGWDAGRLRLRGGLLVGGALAALPWLNVRYAPLSLILVVYVLAGRPRLRAAVASVLPGVLSAIGLATYYHALYGFFDPRRVYGRHPEMSLGTVPEGLPGLLLDQEFGLLVYAPLFALAAPGLLALARRRPRLGLCALALVGVVVGVAASWHMWRGGFNPPARFLVPIVPALLLGVAAWLRRGLGAGGALLVGFSLFMGLAGAAEPHLVHRDRDGTAPLLRTFSGAEEWTRLLPGYVLSEPDRSRLALVWAVALTVAAVGTRRRRLGAGSMALAPAGLLLACALASTLSERRTVGRDAVRLVGRPAIRVPGLHFVRESEAVWGQDLAWGPDYRPRDGLALVGERLELKPGRYQLRLEVERAPGSEPPVLEVRGEEHPAWPRVVHFREVRGGLDAPLVVEPGQRSVTLHLRGTTAFRLYRLHLRLQPSAAPPV
jgi:hypothetical protein